MRPPRVLLLPRLPETVIGMAAEHARAAELELEVADLTTDRAAALDAIGRTDFIIGYPWKMDNEAFGAASGNVRLIQLLSAGFDQIDVDAAKRWGIPIAHNGGANAISVAEHAVTLLLALYKRIVPLSTEVRRGRWTTARAEAKSETFELAGKTIGIVGLGKIGRVVHRLVSAFDTDVRYADLRRDEEYEARTGIGYASLPELLSSVDAILLHVPLLDPSIPLIGHQELALMRRSAVLVNTSRGGLVDEAALFDALRDRRIAGAALDVLAQEPPADNAPLLTLENCLVTPHTAGPTWDSWPRRFENAYRNIRRVVAGGSPEWVIGD